MSRYFVAIPIADDAKQVLLAAQPQASPGVRPANADELHLTLHFLGTLAPPSDAIAKAALSDLRLPAFPITLHDVGTFQGQDDSQVLWAGVESNEYLTALHQEIGRVLSAAIGYQPEARPYVPHVTLARLHAPVAGDVVQQFVDQHRGLLVPSMLVQQFALYSSVMDNDRPVYRKESQYDLLSDSD